MKIGKSVSTISLGLLALIVLIPARTSAETKLFVPEFSSGPREDTQLLTINQNDHDTTIDLWAFTFTGELLGQYQLRLRAHSTRTVTLREAFGVNDETVTGWLGAVSKDDNVQLSYIRIGADGEAHNETLDARVWIAREDRLLVGRQQQSLKLSNPNSYAAQITVNGIDSDGRFVATHSVPVGAFGQTELNVGDLFGNSAKEIRVFSNAEILAALGGFAKPRTVVPSAKPAVKEKFTLMIDIDKVLGAYQVTLQFDPNLVQFSANDIEGGLADGFESRPYVVNIDNAGGRLTLASFQLGNEPTGRVAVARLNVARKARAVPRFAIEVQEITDAVGASIMAENLSVGLVRMD